MNAALSLTQVPLWSQAGAEWQQKTALGFVVKWPQFDTVNLNHLVYQRIID